MSYAYNTLSDNTSILAVWNAHYLTINQANQIIKNVPLVPGADFTVAKKNDLIGQARFVSINALQTFTIVWKATEARSNRCSLSVPVVLEPYDGNVQRPVRNTLKEVYTAIENDLLFAKNFNH
jgi:hypothetical protein